jgi:hypothetical protein
MPAFIALVIACALAGTAVAASADCSARVAEAQGAIKEAEAAVAKAKDSGKAAARGPLDKAKKQALHAEAECKTDGVKNVRKNAESGREAREAQGLAEEAKMLAEKL